MVYLGRQIVEKSTYRQQKRLMIGILMHTPIVIMEYMPINRDAAKVVDGIWSCPNDVISR